MIALTGRGFDSRQLHKKVKADTPARGFLFLTGPDESLLSEGDWEKRKARRSLVNAFTCIFETKGRPIRRLAERHPRQLHKKVKQTPPQGGFCFYRT